MSWRAVVAVILLIAGGLIELIAVLGICVMRDAYDRLHYPGLAGFGGFLIGVAVLIRESFSLIGDKALLVGLILVLAGPILVQTTMRSLLIRELGDWRSKAPPPFAAGNPIKGKRPGAADKPTHPREESEQ